MQAKIILYRFYMQVAITGTVALFCMFNLTFNSKGSRANQALFASTLTFIVGFWLPSPGSQKTSGTDIESEVTNVFPPNEK